MSVALSGVGSTFDLAGWRDKVGSRREMIRWIVITILERGEHQLEPTLEEVKRALAYHSLSQRDRAIVRTTFKDIRTIVRGWRSLTKEEQAAFHQNKSTPSTVATHLRSLPEG